MDASGKKAAAFTGYASRCRIEMQEDQSIESDTEIVVEFAVEHYDDNAEFAANEFTAKAAGRYHYDVQIAWQAALAIHIAEAYVRIDGSEITYCKLAATVIGETFILNMSGDIDLSIGSIIDVQVLHDKGANILLDGGSGVPSIFSIHRFA